MSTKSTIVEHLVEQLGRGVTAKRMFGEYGLYRDGLLFALVCDDQLFIKQTDAGRALLGQVEEAPPYPGAKPAFLISGDLWDDLEWMTELARVTAVALSKTVVPPKRKSKTNAKSEAKLRPKAKPKPPKHRDP